MNQDLHNFTSGTPMSSVRLYGPGLGQLIHH